MFDLQTPVAESFGYKPTATKRASEQLMRRYYWSAKAVTQLATILIQNIEAQLFPSTSGITRVLSERFVEKQGMLEIASDDVFQREPNAILEAFLLYEQTPGVKGLSARTLRAIYNARDVMDQHWRRDPENRRLFMEILKQPAGITHALRLMNQTSVLGRYLLNFRRIVGQMQHDLYHVYTVDQHILMVLRNLRRFAVAEHAHEYPFCSQLIANFDRPWVLYVAALFHDIAKGRGGDHSTLGMADARRFCRNHGIEGEDGELVVWLVAAASDHEPGRAEAGHERPGSHQALCRTGRHRAPPDRALSADRGRHSRHQPESLEHVERQAARRPVPRDAGRARRRAARRAFGTEVAPGRGARAAAPRNRAGRRAKGAVGQAGRRLFPASRRGGYRVANARAVRAMSKRRRRSCGRVRRRSARRFRCWCT